MEPLDDVAVAVDQELCEIPLDVAWFLGACQTVLGEQFTQFGDFRLGRIVLRSCSLEELVDRIGVRSVHLDLGKLIERCIVLERAELVDFVIAPRRLVSKLVAREVEYLKPLVVVLGVELFKPRVLRREATARGGVDDQEHLALERCDVKARSVAALGRELIDAVHVGFLLLVVASAAQKRCRAERRKNGEF